MRKYLTLIKYKLSLTVSLSAMVGYFLYMADPEINMLFVFLGVFLMAGGSSALNQYQERKWDKMMTRTGNRPLPAGSISPGEALTITATCIAAGAGLLMITGWIPFLLGLLNIFFYNALYTNLKRLTVFAILPGGLVGAVPPVIGWTAAGGGIFHPNILFLAVLVFLWQVPHFWLLLIRYGKEYEDAGFESITKYLDKKQVNRLIFFWIIISASFIGTYPMFGLELHLVLAIILIIINISSIALLYYMIFRFNPKNQKSTAFILTNIILSLILIIFIVNALV